ncbi:hypothetical protein ACF3OH_12110 [Chryseomicrobium aureum]|uniref:hypothetical protein n=1 Tax=Chryseomicrobium aureum TaxID=1441723 RepID=UPI00370D0BCF
MTNLLVLPIIIKNDKLQRIIDARKPLGRFISYQKDIWIAVDNRRGYVHKKQFETLHEALTWLK